MMLSLLSWYLVVQMVALAVLPLGLRLFASLPDRGYSFAKSLGILLVGFLFWWGYSYGLLRNDAGGAWLSLALMALFSALAGRKVLADAARTGRLPVSGGAILTVETLFLVGFLAWAVVRAYDPAANHTEQPMDLMFMNSLWVDAAYPPQDAWFAGYAISYYYFGYWLLVTLGRLSGLAPAVAYTVGQACWFGLLLIGSFGVVYNLLAWRNPVENEAGAGQSVDGQAVAGGLLASVMVAISGNSMVILEWLYANGVPMDRVAAWFAVQNFPANASVSNEWFIGRDWWWWRSGRVLEDLDLLGNHIEVIAEFPMFSYLLGDNHPHVMAMPMVLTVIGLAMGIVMQGASREGRGRSSWLRRLGDFVPMRWTGLLVVTIASGALLFLNTWDYPPYWALLVASVFVVALAGRGREELGEQQDGIFWPSIGHAAAIGVILAVGAVALYLPYFLTAQSQAGGFLPNLFNPTRLPQFLLFFGIGLSAMVVLIVTAWSRLRPAWGKVGVTVLLVYGLPILFLVATTMLATGTSAGETLLARVPLPPDGTSYVAMIVQRWTAQPWSFLLAGGLLAAVLVLIWSALDRVADGEKGISPPTLFALMMAALGLGLVYAPEFIYLRDNFGTRMNTVFKFYYQGWLLFGLSGSYAMVQAWRERGGMPAGSRAIAALATVVSLLLVFGGLLFPIAGVYSKTGGFGGTPTLDSTAYVANENPAELAAAAWIRDNTAPDALVLEGKGASYRANFSRMSAMTGRPTLLGWDGHESQWRGSQYGSMVAGRPEALETIYRSGLASQVALALENWDIDYVYIGPSERWQYGITPATEAAIAEVMDLVFEDGDVRIYRRRG